MVKNIWERTLEAANMMGLVSGAVAVIFLGYQLDNNNLVIAGYTSFWLFIALLIIIIVLMLRDAYLHPDRFRATWQN